MAAWRCFRRARISTSTSKSTSTSWHRKLQLKHQRRGAMKNKSSSSTPDTTHQRAIESSYNRRRPGTLTRSQMLGTTRREGLAQQAKSFGYEH